MIALSPQRADPDAWDILSLDGKEFGGTARLKVVRGRDLEEKKVPGEHGEDLDDKGTRSAKITITLRTWTDADYKKNEALLKELDPTPGKAKAKVISIVHAVTSARNIGFCVLGSIEGPNDEEDGFTTWKIDARERLKPNTNNVGLGPPAGQTCDEMRREYAVRRDDYMTANARARNIIPSLRAQQLEGIGTDEARAQQIELKIREIETDVANKLAMLRRVRDRMFQKACPNVPPDAGAA